MSAGCVSLRKECRHPLWQTVILVAVCCEIISQTRCGCQKVLTFTRNGAFICHRYHNGIRSWLDTRHLHHHQHQVEEFSKNKCAVLKYARCCCCFRCCCLCYFCCHKNGIHNSRLYTVDKCLCVWLASRFVASPWHELWMPVFLPNILRSLLLPLPSVLGRQTFLLLAFGFSLTPYFSAQRIPVVPSTCNKPPKPPSSSSMLLLQ